MLQESKDIIIKHFVTLMKNCDVNVLKDLMVNKGVFTKEEINCIFSTPDEKHNKRVFFFDIQKKEQKAFQILITCLNETNQHKIADLLVSGNSACKPFCHPPGNEDDVRSIPIYDSPNRHLEVKVVRSKQFHDTVERNGSLAYYTSRSKNRGRVLIINNYDYDDKERHPYRNGALVDTRNLKKLFTQMGGWDIISHENRTSTEINLIITEFAANIDNNKYDICFVIMMGHGGNKRNQTVIYGVDGGNVHINNIESQFSNEKCLGFRGRPKVLLFQLCRGNNLDHTIRHTETDSAQVERISISINKSITGDMLVGFPTLFGLQSHRDTERGSWYIELICEKFMEEAHRHNVVELLQLVDQALRTRLSETHTMQTAELCNKGFKKLYLHPGIYYENAEMFHFPICHI